ncbi:MAG: hypothetical protein RIM23_24510 [Coleofasciculus sp. G3-WIS-01]
MAPAERLYHKMCPNRYGGCYSQRLFYQLFQSKLSRFSAKTH